jgi:hypothetical protein
MNHKLDRRRIEGLLLRHFPDMAGKSSEEWHFFLNAKTGLDLPPGMDNAGAFDEWRKALAAQGYEDVWDYTPAQLADMKARAQAMLETKVAE